MKNFLFLLLLLPQVLLAKTDIDEQMIAQIYLQSSEVDKSLTNNNAVYEFHFETYNLEDRAQTTVSYSIDGESRIGALEDNLLIWLIFLQDLTNPNAKLPSTSMVH